MTAWARPTRRPSPSTSRRLKTSAPAGTDDTVATTTDTPYVFAPADLGFTDAHGLTDADDLSAITIATLPAVGVLADNGTPILAGSSIPIADITGGDLASPAGAGPYSPRLRIVHVPGPG